RPRAGHRVPRRRAQPGRHDPAARHRRGGRALLLAQPDQAFQSGLSALGTSTVGGPPANGIVTVAWPRPGPSTPPVWASTVVPSCESANGAVPSNGVAPRSRASPVSGSTAKAWLVSWPP